MRVVFPTPLDPTMAIFSPGLMLKRKDSVLAPRLQQFLPVLRCKGPYQAA